MQRLPNPVLVEQALVTASEQLRELKNQKKHKPGGYGFRKYGMSLNDRIEHQTKHVKQLRATYKAAVKQEAERNGK